MYISFRKNILIVLWAYQVLPMARVLGRPPTWASLLRRPPGFIDLRIGQPERAKLPAQLVIDAAVDAWSGPYGADNDPSNWLQYGAEDGYTCVGALRDFLNRHDLSRKVPLLNDDGLMMTAGISQSLDLICSVFTNPGDTIVVEAPTYFLAHRIFQDHKLIIVEANFSREGEFESMLEAHKPRMAYCVPTYQNPGASTLSEKRRMQIVRFLSHTDTILVSDEGSVSIPNPNPNPHPNPNPYPHPNPNPNPNPNPCPHP